MSVFAVSVFTVHSVSCQQLKHEKLFILYTSAKNHHTICLREKNKLGETEYNSNETQIMSCSAYSTWYIGYLWLIDRFKTGPDNVMCNVPPSTSTLWQSFPLCFYFHPNPPMLQSFTIICTALVWTHLLKSEKLLKSAQLSSTLASDLLSKLAQPSLGAGGGAASDSHGELVSISVGSAGAPLSPLACQGPTKYNSSAWAVINCVTTPLL